MAVPMAPPKALPVTSALLASPVRVSSLPLQQAGSTAGRQHGWQCAHSVLLVSQAWPQQACQARSTAAAVLCVLKQRIIGSRRLAGHERYT